MNSGVLTPVFYSAVTFLCLSRVRSDSTGLISAERVDGASRTSCLFAQRRTEGRRSGFRSCIHVIRNSIKRENEALNAFDPPLSPTLCPGRRAKDRAPSVQARRGQITQVLLRLF